MSTSMYLCGADFELPQKHFEAALQAVKKADIFPYAKRDLESAQTLEKALEEWGWSVVINERTGNIIDISFEGENYHNEDELFEALGPYVKAGSFIEVNIQGDYYRYFFDGRQCHDQVGEIVYPEIPIYPEEDV